MNKKYNLIFDFDGTLVDSFPVAIEKLTLLANEFNFHRIDSSEIETLKNLTSKEVIHYLKIPFYKLPQIVHRTREHMKTEMLRLPTILDLPDVLIELKHLGCTLSILTSNSWDNVTSWLKQHQLAEMFHFIYAGSSLFGKARLLKTAINKHSMDLTSTFYIGDETRDIEAAKKCNIQSIAVTWGFSSEKLLSQHNPTHIANNPKNILTILKA